MTPGRSADTDADADTEAVAARDWPDFELSPTFNPTFLPASVSVDTDEVVIYDPSDAEGGSEQWLSATRESHLSLPDCR